MSRIILRIRQSEIKLNLRARHPPGGKLVIYRVSLSHNEDGKELRDARLSVAWDRDLCSFSSSTAPAASTGQCGDMERLRNKQQSDLRLVLQWQSVT